MSMFMLWKHDYEESFSNVLELKHDLYRESLNVTFQS